MGELSTREFSRTDQSWGIRKFLQDWTGNMYGTVAKYEYSHMVLGYHPPQDPFDCEDYCQHQFNNPKQLPSA